MWIREDLKGRAKGALRANGYWIALVVVLISAVLAGGFGGGSANQMGGLGGRIDSQPGGADTLDGIPGALIVLFATTLALIVLASLAYGIFVALPLTVGKSRFFLEHRSRPSGVAVLFSAFKRGYLNVVRTMFLSQLFIFLWSLLLIVPGIIKSYQYFLVPYILSENPGLPWRRALDLSRTMTQGSKLRIFVLQLSFIGWYLLGMLALGVGILFVQPYYEATAAELYAALREQALARGLVAEGELPGVG